MSERIDAIAYLKSPTIPTSVAEGEQTSLFLTGPAEFLCEQIATSLKADPSWSAIFNGFIDAYKRMDYPIRALPVLRIYNNTYVKEFESWFIRGDIVLDLIFPASLRRRDTEQIPDTVTAALLQQFRRPTFFNKLTQVVPGLNELGKAFNVDKSLAFEWEEELVPLTQVLVNFRMDLRVWDDYLEADARTKDDPFTRSLANLNEIVTTINALRDDGTTELTLSTDQKF